MQNDRNRLIVHAEVATKLEDEPRPRDVLLVKLAAVDVLGADDGRDPLALDELDEYLLADAGLACDLDDRNATVLMRHGGFPFWPRSTALRADRTRARDSTGA